MKTNKKLINALILIVALILFSSVAYARPVTDTLIGGLTRINDFFANEAYKPYAKTIDFFFFSLLFIAIYMMGARYAFKEIKKPEQVIVILLGLMTAFLLVLAGISATALLPYIHWLFYLLLFMLYWWLLKGIKSKFWRFVLALLLTLLTIALLQGLYRYLTAPKVPEVRAPDVSGIGGFFKDLFASLKGIELPEVGLPKFEIPKPGVKEPTGPTPLPGVTTPKGEEVREVKEGVKIAGLPWWVWLLLLLVILLLRPWRWDWKKLKPKPKKKELTVEQIIALIEEIIIKKGHAKDRINEKLNQKIDIIKAADKAQAFVRSYTKDDIANIWTDPVREKIRQAGAEFLEFIDKEKEFVNELKELKDIEVNKLYNELREWKRILEANRIDANQILDELKDIIALKTAPREIKRIGIIWLILICYNYVKKEISYGKEEANALRGDNIEELVKDRLETVNNDEKNLRLNLAAEIGIVELLNAKIELQIEKLKELSDNIRGVTRPAPTVELTANPTTIAQGESSTLTWDSTNAVSCSADWTTSTATSGSQIVSPTATTTYTIRCRGPGGVDSASAIVNVTPPVTPPIPPPFIPPVIPPVVTPPTQTTSIQDLTVTPVEAKQEPGVPYRTPIKISTVVEQGVAPFKAYCYVFKFVEGKFVQVYPAYRPQLKTKAELDQPFLSEEFEKTLSHKRSDIEAYKRIEEFSSKPINQISDKVEFTTKDFGNLEPGTYRVLIQVKGSILMPKFAARKQVMIIIKKPEAGQLGFDLQPTLSLTLTPLNSEPSKPINIISNYHKDRDKYLTIGKGEDNNIILVDTEDEAEPQVVIGFITEYNTFGLFKVPPYSTKIELYDASTGYSPITENVVLLQDEFRIKINGYEFVIGVKTSYEYVPPREKYMEQFTPGIRLKLKPKIKVLKLRPDPKKVIPDETIELIGDYHSSVDNALKIGKGTDVGASESRRNYMHLTDTQIYPRDDINKPQAVILFDKNSGRFGIAKFTKETKIQLNDRLVEESKWLGNSGTIVINEYEFDFETEETDKITSREKYFIKFPVELRLVLKAITKILTLYPNPNKIVQSKPIELIGDYHCTVDDAVKIGKGSDIRAPKSRENRLHLADTQIYPRDNINKPQVVILFDKNSGRFGIAKFTKETRLLLDNIPIEQSRWLDNFRKITINEYEFKYGVEETTQPIPSKDDYLSQKGFPIILNLRSAEIDITHLAPGIEEGLTEFDEWLIRQEARAKRALERGRKAEFNKILSETIKEFRRVKQSLQKRINYSNVAKTNIVRVEELMAKLTSEIRYARNDKRFDHFHTALGIIYEMIKLTDDSKIPVAGMKLARKVPYSRTREKAMLRRGEIGPEPFGMPPKEPWEEEALEEYRRRQATEPKTIDERWAPLLKTPAPPPTSETPPPLPEEKPHEAPPRRKLTPEEKKALANEAGIKYRG